jgi:hypothetical protein
MSFQHLKHRHFQKWSSSLMPGISRLIRSSYLPINSWKPAKKTCFFSVKKSIDAWNPSMFQPGPPGPSDNSAPVSVFVASKASPFWSSWRALCPAWARRMGTDRNRWEQMGTVNFCRNSSRNMRWTDIARSASGDFGNSNMGIQFKEIGLPNARWITCELRCTSARVCSVTPIWGRTCLKIAVLSISYRWAN